MDWIRTLLEQQPLMTLFLTIAIGYIVGEINIKGFSLGVGAVLFVALFFVGGKREVPTEEEAGAERAAAARHDGFDGYPVPPMPGQEHATVQASAHVSVPSGGSAEEQ